MGFLRRLWQWPIERGRIVVELDSHRRLLRYRREATGARGLGALPEYSHELVCVVVLASDLHILSLRKCLEIAAP